MEFLEGSSELCENLWSEPSRIQAVYPFVEVVFRLIVMNSKEAQYHEIS